MVILFCIGFVILVLSFTIYNRHRRRRTEHEIAKNWTKSKPAHQFFYFEQIRSLAKYAPNWPSSKLSTQTQGDLDFDEVFMHVDRTVSCIGQQYLFQNLVYPKQNIESLAAFEKRIQFFSTRPDLAISIRKKLIKLSHPDAYSLVKLIHEPNFKKINWYYLLVIDSVLLLLSFIFLLFIPKLLIGILFLLCINMGLYFWNKNNILLFTKSLPQLRFLIQTAAQINKELLGQERDTIARSIKRLTSLKRKMSLISFDFFSNDADPSQLLKYVVDLIKAFFLIEIHVFFRVMKDVSRLNADIALIFDFVASCDQYISIAALRSDNEDKFCIPQFASKKNIQVKDIYHPLIDHCVENSLDLENHSCLITGSNMSGKSSFLRTIAINAILAQSIHTCFAKAYHAPLFNVHTALRINDNLADGKSYYKAEVDLISNFIDHSKSDMPCLFLMDEVFKGTNTLERVAAAAAVLKYLVQKNHMVFVATHDVELIELIGDQYQSYHFEETVVDGQFYFDHKIKKGVVKTTNAIHILAISNFPDQLVMDAKKLFSQIKIKQQ